VSELFDDDLSDLPPRPSRRTKIIIAAAVAVVVLLIAVTAFARVYTDGLWYGALGYGTVFDRLFWTKTLLFLVAALLMALFLGAAMVLAFRTRPFYHPAEEHSSIARYRDAINPIRTWLMVGICVVAGAFAGVSGAGQWRTFLLWRHGVPFGQSDPYFGRDIGFYVFTLPWWQYVVHFLLVALVLALVASVVVHYLYGGIRLAGHSERFSGPAQAQLSVLVGLALVVKAIGYWLSRYALVHHAAPLFTGMGYTDHHAVLPGKNILTGVALICALLFFVNAWRRRWLMPTVALGLLAASAILLGLIWPAIVQGFQVKPSQLDKESSYIEANIAATRTAYGIDDSHVKVERYSAAADPKASAKQLDNEAKTASVVDPGLAQQEFQQTQQGRSFYAINEPLATDHYAIDGTDRALVLGVRELNQSGINAGDQNWTELHTVYTHGNGVVAAYANQRNRSDATEETTTQYAEGASDNGTSRDLETSTGKFQNQVYFGQDSPSYSIVGHPAGTPAVELDTAPDGTQTTTTYAGAGGVPIGSTFRRLMYAVKFDSANFLLSGRVNKDSKVLYDRSPLDRVAKVAPWLTLDGDVYPVVHDGRLLWVVDGYTTTDNYPGSDRESFSTMTDDATQSPTGAQTLTTDQINYMRNSVKATVDAYDGAVTLYEWDTTDPMLKAWEGAFPGIVRARATIPPDLLKHFRYPDELFKVQRYQLARYHVTDPTAFLEGIQRWQVPADPNNQGHLETPYRSFIDTPIANPLDPAGSASTARTSPVWSLTSALVPYQRQNLAALMTVDSDGALSDYGTIRVLTGFGEQTNGPQLISQAFLTNTTIADAFARFSRSSAVPTPGNMMAIPTAGSGLLWVEPLYAYPTSGSTSRYPVLSAVMVSYGDKQGYGRTLEQALASAIAGKASGPSSGTPPGGATSSRNRIDAQAARLLAQAERLFAQAGRASKAGDYPRAATYNRQARAEIARARALLVPHPSGTPSAAPSSSATPTSPPATSPPVTSPGGSSGPSGASSPSA